MYQAYMALTTKLAFEFIDMDAQTYQMSVKEAEAKPEIAVQLHKDEE